jgi:tyrosine-protein kinase Etk/Wzc
MNTNHPIDPHLPDAASAAPAVHIPTEHDKAEDFRIGEIFASVWDGRYLFLAAIVLSLAVGLFYVYSTSPVFEVEGLLQTEGQKNYGSQGTEFTKMEGVYSQQTVTEAEAEIVKSNLVLGRVVSNLRLDIDTSPILPPLLGNLLHHDRTTRPLADVAVLDMPEALKGARFQLVKLPGGDYQVLGPDGSVIGKGSTGDRLSLSFAGNPIQLQVRSLRGKPGQAYTLRLVPQIEAINALRRDLIVEERGKNVNAPSNILGLTYQSGDPVLAANILNEVLNQYIRQAIERKSGDSAKALEMLQGQRPLLQAQVTDAENRLNGYRQQHGAVDLARESDLALQEGSNLESQITALRQRRQELLRTYTEHSDLVTTVDQQIARLQAESKQNEQKVSELPRIQQDFVALTRDVQVKNDAYTALLNSIQQLQNTLAGSLGNARVVDYAIPSFDPVAPRKKMLMVLFGFIGILLGAGVNVVRRMLNRGVEDHRIIEAKLGMPILVTIPHSEAQKDMLRNIQRHAPGTHVLALGQPEDMATESIRSLRTVLHFTMENVRNRLVLITGPSPNIGKSFVSTNLAAVLAQGGASVLLVDADMRRGNLHRAFGFKGRAGGLAEILSGRTDWRSMVKETAVPNVGLISTGVLPPDPLVLLMSPLFSTFTQEVSEVYDFVIVDAPPILPVSDSLIIGSKVDTILMVAKYGAHPLDELRTSQNRLKNLNRKLKGCIFNDIKLVGVQGLYGYYKYNYQYKYERG